MIMDGFVAYTFYSTVSPRILLLEKLDAFPNNVLYEFSIFMNSLYDFFLFDPL